MIAHEKTLAALRKRHLKGVTESLLITRPVDWGSRICHLLAVGGDT